jgi:hypothetical protein
MEKRDKENLGIFLRLVHKKVILFTSTSNSFTWVNDTTDANMYK